MTKHDFEISNDSSYTVTFQIRGYGDTVYTLASGEKQTFDLYDHPTLIFSGNLRVTYISKTSSASIFDMAVYTYVVTNNSLHDVVLQENNGMLGATPDTTVRIAGGTQTLQNDGETILTTYHSESITVYTESPVWAAYYEIDDPTGTLDENGSVAKIKTDALQFLSFTATPQ